MNPSDSYKSSARIKPLLAPRLVTALLVVVSSAIALVVDLALTPGLPIAWIYAIPLLLAALHWPTARVLGLGGVLLIMHIGNSLFKEIEPWVEIVYAIGVVSLVGFAAILAHQRQQLRTAAERFRVAVGAAPITVATVDRELRYSWIHNPHADFSGAAVLGKRDDELATNDGTRALMALKRRVLEQGVGSREEIDFPLSDGVRTYDITAEPLRDGSGAIVGVTTAAFDTSERKQTQRALQESEARFRAVFEASPTGIGLVGPDAQFVATNPSYRELVGYTEAELATMAGTAVVHADDLPAQAPLFEELMLGKRQRYDLETRLVRKDGEIRWAHVTATMIRDQSGAPQYGLALVEDITERRRMTDELSASRELFASVATLAPVGIFRTDRSGGCVYVNARWCDLAGLTPEEASGAGWVRALHPDDRERIAALWAETIAEGVMFRAEYRLCRPDGPMTWVIGQAIPERASDGAIVGYVGTVTDISERREQERIQQMFLATVTHDLRTPLTSISGYAQLLQRRGEFDARSVETILTQVRRMQQLTQDLMDVARSESGALILRPEPFDLLDLARESVTQAQALNPAHRFHLEAPAGPLIGSWDRDRLAQVFQNLLGNGAKYSPDGGKITVQIERLETDVTVAVRDEGIGLAPAALERVFDRFYRAHDGDELRGESLGLGLYIAKSLVEAHSGQIWAESPGEGHGTTFHFVLPMTPPD